VSCTACRLGAADLHVLLLLRTCYDRRPLSFQLLVEAGTGNTVGYGSAVLVPHARV
jgi:hypothetical protein